jgi:hypothetical protein
MTFKKSKGQYHKILDVNSKFNLQILSLLCPCLQKLIKLTAQAGRDCSGFFAAVHISSEN